MTHFASHHCISQDSGHGVRNAPHYSQSFFKTQNAPSLATACNWAEGLFSTTACARFAKPCHPELHCAANYILPGGGYLRPLLVYLSADLFGKIGQTHGNFAQSVEYLHCASLLHDDVMDGGKTRRGRPCLHQKRGIGHSILSGDFLLLQAFDSVHGLNNREISELVLNAASQLLWGQMEGECLSFSSTASHYLSVAKKKTATLLMLACQGSAMLSNAPPIHAEKLGMCALLLGTAYQIWDDIREYKGQHWDQGHDFWQKKWTYPVLLAKDTWANARTKNSTHEGSENAFSATPKHTWHMFWECALGTSFFSLNNVETEQCVQRFLAPYLEQATQNCQWFLRRFYKQLEKTFPAKNLSLWQELCCNFFPKDFLENF